MRENGMGDIGMIKGGLLAWKLCGEGRVVNTVVNRGSNSSSDRRAGVGPPARGGRVQGVRGTGAAAQERVEALRVMETWSSHPHRREERRNYELPFGDQTFSSFALGSHRCAPVSAVLEVRLPSPSLLILRPLCPCRTGPNQGFCRSSTLSRSHLCSRFASSWKTWVNLRMECKLHFASQHSGSPLSLSLFTCTIS